MTEAPSTAAAPTEVKTAKPSSGVGPALDWWRYHCDPATADPGVRAQLRRCDSPVDASAIAAAVALARRLRAFDTNADDRRVTEALNLARVLAHVREHAPGPPMRYPAGWKNFAGDRKESDVPSDERPRISEARFRRLLATGPDEEQVAAFVRLIGILDGKIDVAALAADYLDWNHPWKGERVRKRWAEDYFAARVFETAAGTTDASTSNTPSPTAEDDA